MALELIKGIVKFFVRKDYRIKTLREVKIRSQQNKLIDQRYNPDSKNLIIFLIDGAELKSGKEIITGGIMSIASIYEETCKLASLHKSSVLICTCPDENLLLKFHQFESSAIIFRLEQVLKYFTKAENVLIHIPEFLYPYFIHKYEHKNLNHYLRNKRVHVNIMNQNINLMPTPDVFNSTRHLFDKITMTTAHEKYSTPEMAARYQMPLHKLSVYGGPELYKFSKFSEKEDLMIVSPDDHPNKDFVLAAIRKAFPELNIVIIKNLPYPAYRALIAKAKWALTFGEGLDYYFLETVFSGGISFAVYNSVFFTSDFEGLETVYNNFEELEQRIVNNIIKLNQEQSFNQYNQILYSICKKLYKQDVYINNIKLFYEEQYTFPLIASNGNS